MRTPVECQNCGIKWLRVITWGSDVELNDDLMYNCPNCIINFFEPVEGTKKGEGLTLP